MAIIKAKKELIAHAAIKVLYTRFNSFPEEDSNNRNAPFHVAFVSAFKTKLDGRVKSIPDFISLSSWMHGLTTSLGMTFFEDVAQILCDGEKKSFNSKHIYSNQVAAISDILIDLKNGTEKPSVKREDSIISSNAHGEKQDASKFTADCFYETEKEVVAIELKSVRPNSGEMRGEKQKILTGKAVLRELYPNKKVKYIFGFPFDPTSNSDTGYEKQRFLRYLVEAEKFVAHDDFLIAEELWSFLASSDGAMQEILEIINCIATPHFIEKFNIIQNTQIKNEEKRKILEEWFLYSEIEIIDKVQPNSSNMRIYNQAIFKNDGSYNINRLRLLQH